jgi:hypothetical protein
MSLASTVPYGTVASLQFRGHQVPYRTVLYGIQYRNGLMAQYRTVRYRYGPVRRYRITQFEFSKCDNPLYPVHIADLICSSGFFAHANHLFYRFRMAFRVRNGIVTFYESCVRLISPSNLAHVRVCVRARVRARYEAPHGRLSGGHARGFPLRFPTPSVRYILHIHSPS